MNKSKYEELEDVIKHKQYVLQACWKMSRYLFSTGKEDLGLELLKRATIHDNSKLEDEELEALSKISEDKSSLKDANEKLTDFKKKAIELHWKNNRHHPEFFSDVKNMSELDILEMVCDWYARSIQYNTNLIEFCETRQENRFHFPKDIYKKIHKYCEIISKEDNYKI